MDSRTYRVITNNPLVAATWPGSVEWVSGSVKDVFRCVRDYVHAGHVLLTHPLSGSVKPNESPYKSVIITDYPASAMVDLDSLRIIEGAMVVLHNLGAPSFTHIPPRVDDDYQLIDCDLMASAIESLHDAAWNGPVEGCKTEAFQ